MTISKKIVHQTLACIPAILNQYLIGLGWGWIPPTLVKLKNPQSTFGLLTVEQLSWLASINEMGRLLGPVISPAIIDNVGRKFSMYLLSVTYFVVWLLVCFANNVYLLLASRLLFGLANGMNDVLTGIYITENCSPDVRGVIASVTILAHLLGIFSEISVATYLSFTSTAIANTTIVVCVFASLYLCIETPYFLVMKGKRAEAEKNLIWLSGNVEPVEVADELEQIVDSVEAEKLKTQSLKLLFFSSANLRGILVVVGLHVLQMMAGQSAHLTYAPLIFSSSERLTTDQFTVLYTFAQLVAVVITPFIIEKMNRRFLIVATFAGVVTGNVCSYLLIYARSNGYEIVFHPWLIFASISLCGMLISIASPVINSIKGELLPLSVRAIGSSIAITAHSFTSFCVIKAFLPLTDSYSMEMNFLIYSTVSLLGIMIIYYVLPETRGKTLYELQNMGKTKGVLVKQIPGDQTENKYIFSQ